MVQSVHTIQWYKAHNEQSKRYWMAKWTWTGSRGCGFDFLFRPQSPPPSPEAQLVVSVSSPLDETTTTPGLSMMRNRRSPCRRPRVPARQRQSTALTTVQLSSR